MIVIPNLAHDSPASIITALPHICGVVAWSRASNVGFGARLLGQGFLDIRQRICRLVARYNLGLIEPFPGWVTLVPLDGGFEELNDVLVLGILRPVARDVEGREASRVLAELMGPEVGVGCPLVDPVRVHPIDQVVSAECFQEGLDCRTFVCRHHRSIGERICCIRRWYWVVLAL